jgi:hypothetical protein
VDAKAERALEELPIRFEALSSSAIEMGESLRNEIILGRQQKMQVLPDMIQATEDALQALSGDSPTTEAMQNSMSSLQKRINEAVALAMLTARVEEQEELRVVASRLQERFSELSNEVHQSSAENQVQMLATSSCLKDGLASVLDGLQDIKYQLDIFKSNQDQLGKEVSQLVADNADLKSLMRTLISGEHKLPTLAVILPVVSNSWKKKTSPMQCVRNQYRLYFLCDYTRQIAPCGPKGRGYVVNVTKEWVVRAKPVLRVGLVLLRVALLASGLPLPVPDLCSVLDDTTIKGKYLDAALKLVESPPADGGAEFSMKEPLECIAECKIEDLVGGENKVLLPEASKLAYENIMALLRQEEVDIKSTCGLRQVTHGGKTAWVLDNDATERAYKAEMEASASAVQPSSVEERPAGNTAVEGTGTHCCTVS